MLNIHVEFHLSSKCQTLNIIVSDSSYCGKWENISKSCCDPGLWSDHTSYQTHLKY